MSNLNQFFAAEPAVTSIVCTDATTSQSFASSTNITLYGNVKVALSGALTADTLATMLSITGGGGYLDVFAISAVDATARNLRVKITADGASVLDLTTATAVANRGLLAVGNGGTAAGALIPSAGVPVRFNSSLLVEISSSITETDLVNVYYAHRLT